MEKPKQNKHKDYSKYFFIIFIVLMIILAFAIIKPFIASLLGSVVLCYLFYPLYKLIKKRIKNENVAALIISLFIVILLFAPLFFVITTITKEVHVTYLILKQQIFAVDDFLKTCNQTQNSIENSIELPQQLTKNPFCGFIGSIHNLVNNPKVKYYLQTGLEKGRRYIMEVVSNLVFSIPKFCLNFVVMLFTLFYLFKDGDKALSELRKLLPLEDVYKKHLFERFGRVTSALIYGHVTIALIQGILGAFGFFIFGISSPILWGVVMAFTALIPFIGTSIIWLPAALIKLFGGILANNTSEIVGGVLFILYGLIIITGLEHILKPKIIGDKAKVHPVLILIGFLGGLHIFGFIGVVVGPLVLALFVTFLKVYAESKLEK